MKILTRDEWKLTNPPETQSYQDYVRMMKGITIPTAEELYNDFHFNYKGNQNSILEGMKVFAKLHVQAALKHASENYAQGSFTPGKGVSIKDAILNAYPLNKIK